MRHKQRLAIGSAATLLAVAAGCASTPEPAPSPTVPTTAPSTASPTLTPTSSPAQAPSPSVSVTPALSGDQEAALGQARGFLAADEKLSARPASKFSQKLITETLAPFATGPIITSMLDGYRDRADEGIHVVGQTLEGWADVAAPTRPDNTTSIEVVLCRDQRETQAVNGNGKVVDKDHPDFVRLGLEMRDVAGAFKVWQIRSLGESCDR
jgi:hypothetical protein